VNTFGNKLHSCLSISFPTVPSLREDAYFRKCCLTIEMRLIELLCQLLLKFLLLCSLTYAFKTECLWVNNRFSGRTHRTVHLFLNNRWKPLLGKSIYLHYSIKYLAYNPIATLNTGQGLLCRLCVHCDVL